MRSQLVLTVSGRDRLGVVKTVSNTVFENGGNLLQSRMARLGGEFTGILLVSVADENLDGLMTDLSNLSKLGLRAYVREASDDSLEARKGLVPYEVKVSGADQEGILHAIADKMSAAGINIEELTTEVTNAPITGTPLFSMTAVVAVQGAPAARSLRDSLQPVADAMALELEIRMCVS